MSLNTDNSEPQSKLSKAQKRRVGSSLINRSNLIIDLIKPNSQDDY